MTMIAPSTQIILCSGVNIDRSYAHTLRSDNAQDQFNKIVKYKKRIFDKNTYQRSNEGKLRIQVLADDIYDCNYLIFQNSAFGNKYFYAFIDSIDYINNNCTEITYSIDVMQTWLFDFTMQQSFVEREHSASDNFGENVIPESLGSGDLTVEQIKNFNFENKGYTIVIYYTAKDKFLEGTVFNYWYKNLPVFTTGNLFEDFPYPTTNETVCGYHIAGAHYDEENPRNIGEKIKNFVKETNDKSNIIVSMAEIPTAIFDACVPDYDRQATIANKSLYSSKTTITQAKSFKYKNQDKYYIPKNNKCYQYPYRQLMVTNNTGNTATFKWEDFKTPQEANFEVQGTILPVAEATLLPLEYRQLSKDYASALVLSDFVNISWSENSFDKWWTQNRNGIAFGLVSSAIGTAGSIGIAAATGGASVLTGTLISGSVSAQKNIFDTIGQIKDAKNVPDQVYGQVGASTSRLINNKLGYTFYDMGTDGETIQSIDTYFTMFGYATKRVKIPNLFAVDATTKKTLRRPRFNYLKTQGCVIHPSSTHYGLNAADEEKICAIFDNGITFWENLEDVGNYSLDNQPSGGENPKPAPIDPITPTNMRYPFKNITSFKLTQGFTSKYYDQGHQGYDLVGLRNGSASRIEVISILPGKVIWAGQRTSGSLATYGNYVEIKQDGKLFRYAHLASVAVSAGDTVQAGQVIGIMGNTGVSTGTHLHFDVHEEGANYYLDPEQFTHIPDDVVPKTFYV